MICAFTAATPDYLEYANALKSSFYKHNPHGVFFIEIITNDFKDEAEKIGYSANIRCELTEKFMKKGFNNLLYLDADSIVRGSLDQLESLDDEFDLFAFPRPWMELDMHKFLISTIFLRATEKTKAFVKAWKEETYSNPLDLMTCQPAFYEVSKKNIAKIGDLPITYTDWEMKNDSLIWCAKGPRKSEPRFIQESLKYAGA